MIAAERRRKMGMRRKKVEEEVKIKLLLIFTFLEFHRWGLGDGRQQKKSLEGALQGMAIKNL